MTSTGWPKPKFKIDAGKQGRVRTHRSHDQAASHPLQQLMVKILPGDKGCLHALKAEPWPLQVIKVSDSLSKVNELNFNSGE